MEPSPRAIRFVPKVLLPKYGWEHEEAGIAYPPTEMSFRQTISGLNYSDRGFKVVVNNVERKIEISFNSSMIGKRHAVWITSLENRVCLRELSPKPYWGFDDVFHKAGTKLLNTFYIGAETKSENGIEYLRYSSITKLTQFSLEGFLTTIEQGYLFIDFDARTGHNHGTKFRLKQDKQPLLYKNIENIS